MTILTERIVEILKNPRYVGQGERQAVNKACGPIVPDRQLRRWRARALADPALSMDAVRAIQRGRNGGVQSAAVKNASSDYELPRSATRDGFERLVSTLEARAVSSYNRRHAPVDMPN